MACAMAKDFLSQLYLMWAVVIVVIYGKKGSLRVPNCTYELGRPF